MKNVERKPSEGRAADRALEPERRKPQPKRARRTQEERTTETRRALIDAAIRVIHRLGYGGATTALIAEAAGVTRGAILHHFGTRAVLMAEVIREVFEKERDEYYRLQAQAHLTNAAADWPAVLWEVFSQPSGLAVLEILQAARSDPELSERVMSTQQAVEDLARELMIKRFGASGDQAFVDRMRLVVWAIRGLSIAQVLVKDPDEIVRSVQLFSRVLDAAEEAGVFSVEGGKTTQRSCAPS